jgi:hypothetical protein
MGRVITPRRAKRASVFASASCRTATGRQGDAFIVDLTAERCRIVTKAVPLSVGLHLRIRPEQFESLAG